MGFEFQLFRDLRLQGLGFKVQSLAEVMMQGISYKVPDFLLQQKLCRNNRDGAAASREPHVAGEHQLPGLAFAQVI